MMRSAIILLLTLSLNIYAMDLEDLKSFQTNSSYNIENLKYKAIYEEAIHVGTAHGYYKHLNELIETLESQTVSLDKLYDFRSVMRLSSRDSPVSNMLPPIIVEADNEVLLDSKSETLQTSSKIFKILRGAHLISRAPIWQTYLLGKASEPSDPDPALLPKTKEEQLIWEHNVQIGWEKGIELAESEMKTRIRLLSRDYNGMLKYLSLVETGNADPAFVAYSRTAIKGNWGQIKLDNHLYRITKKAKLRTKDW